MKLLILFVCILCASLSHALSWEHPKHPETKKWSIHLEKRISENLENLKLAEDVERFCPRYDVISESEKIHFWAEFMVLVSWFESSWVPNSWMVETGLGKDCVTQEKILSQGLFQLSYCDSTWMPLCKFDYAKDKDLPVNDLNRTINDPFRNIDCAMGILARQVRAKKLIVVQSKPYWSVLFEGKYSKTNQIFKKLQKTAPECF